MKKAFSIFLIILSLFLFGVFTLKNADAQTRKSRKKTSAKKKKPKKKSNMKISVPRADEVRKNRKEKPTASARAIKNARKRKEQRERWKWLTAGGIFLYARIGVIVLLIVAQVVMVIHRKKTKGLRLGSFNITEIHKMAIQGELENLLALLNEHPDYVDYRDKNGRTPLHLAALFAKEDAAEFLIEREADVNAKDKEKRTPLHTAAMGRSKAITVMLIKAGADVNAEDKSGFTPFQLGNIDIQRVLVKYGATH